MTAALHVDNLLKSYGPVQAVREVSFDVSPGEIFGLLGPNGADKTTLIERILGLRQPDSGSISIIGIDAQGRLIPRVPFAGGGTTFAKAAGASLHGVFRSMASWRFRCRLRSSASGNALTHLTTKKMYAQRDNASTR
jgi:ABC-type branched-subunit amino acid transport system ATPase component